MFWAWELLMGRVEAVTRGTFITRRGEVKHITCTIGNRRSTPCASAGFAIAPSGAH